MNIALIAMSGIRVVDSELLELGLTLPGFVERSKVIASLPSLGLLTLAGMTPKEHKIEYLEVAELGEALRSGNICNGYDLVAISSFSAQMNEAYELADIYRLMKIPVVLGGLHASSLPIEASNHADAVVVGEGEVSWLQVLRDAERRQLKSFYNLEKDDFDLNNAPMPAFELLDISKYNRLTVQASRGCPHRCEFCASSILLTSGYKQKPVAKVLAEIDKICEIWPHPFIEFADDNAIVNRKYWKELLPGLAQRGVKWFVETDISIADDPELLSQLHDAGCAQVLIGLESPTQPPLDGLELHNDWKRKQWHRYLQAIHDIQSHGISVNGCFILGLDGHDETIFDVVRDFVRESGLHEVQITIQTPFPGTPLYTRLQLQHRLFYPHDWKRCTLFDLNFKPANIGREEFHSKFHELAVDLYCDDFTKLRRSNYRKAMRSGIAKRHGRPVHH